MDQRPRHKTWNFEIVTVKQEKNFQIEAEARVF